MSTKKIITEIAEEVKVEYGYGFKFLTPFGTTESEQHGSFEYNLPQRGQKWSDVTAHPDPMLVTDSSDCGTGRLHVMNKLSANYAPRHWWPWFVRFDKAHIVGSSLEKTGVRALQLRRIRPAVFHRYIKFGYCRGADLSNANLSNADLSYANLSGANLRGADLSYADLSGADLRGADLSGANLSGANLRGADLSYADLSGANLSYADLSYADLSYADLSYADLSGANLSYANLRGADLSYADLRGARNKELAIGLVEPEPLKSDSSDDDEEDEEDH